jgi:hypothetical protein
LPDGSQLCSNCGEKCEEKYGEECGEKCGEATSVAAAATVIDVPATAVVLPRTPQQPAWPLPRRRQRPRIGLWSLALLVPLAIWWATDSNRPGAQQLQRLFTSTQIESILPTTLSVNPHSFVPYRFTVPASASNAVVFGQFKATGVSTTGRSANSDIEVHVLADAAFAAWQSGYATDTYYSSGRVSQGDINAVLPPGAGAYYVVFNNKFSPRMAKTVQIDLNLRYNQWVPDWVLKVKEQFWTPLGFALVPPRTLGASRARCASE